MNADNLAILIVIVLFLMGGIGLIAKTESDKAKVQAGLQECVVRLPNSETTHTVWMKECPNYCAK